MFRTGRIGSNRRNEDVWQPFEKYSRVENFPNGSEPAVELKIRRASATSATTPGRPFLDNFRIVDRPGVARRSCLLCFSVFRYCMVDPAEHDRDPR